MPSPTTPRATLPEHGLAPDDVLGALAAMRADDVDPARGRTWSLVYPAGEAHEALLTQASALYFSTNALNPLAFPSLLRLEREVVQMSAGLLGGGPSTVGVLTSGGTESILLAVKTARERFKKRRPWVRRPEVVAAETVHPAFDKACDLFGLRLRLVPVGKDLRVNVAAMARAAGHRTALLVASAPQYPHGVIDPVEEVAAIGRKRGIPVHVDACVGGFLLPFLAELGETIPPWNFAVPGVTSMSADLHKYGYAPKGASVLLFRDMAHMRHLFFIYTRWPGGIYMSATLPGSRSGAPIAAAWASMNGLGHEGYRTLAREALATARRLKAGIAAIPGLAVLGDPRATIIAWTSRDPAVDIYAVADQLAAKGWSVDRQQRPPCIHNTVNASNAQSVGAYLADVAAAVAEVREHPELATRGEAAIYGLSARIPAPVLVKPTVRRALEQMYGAEPPPADTLPTVPPMAERILGRLMAWRRSREARG